MNNNYITNFKSVIVYEEFDIECDTLDKSYSDIQGNIFPFMNDDLIYTQDRITIIKLQEIINDLNNKKNKGIYRIEYLPEDEVEKEIEDY